MVCDQCRAEGRKSTIRGGETGISTCMGGVGPWYDEDGKMHRHDPNSTTFTYRCSNGHEWYWVHYYECWCGHNVGRSHRLPPLLDTGTQVKTEVQDK